MSICKICCTKRVVVIVIMIIHFATLDLVRVLMRDLAGPG